MGKDRKGKELGVGISQRKDGLYSGRFVDKNGKRQQKYFRNAGNGLQMPPIRISILTYKISAAYH